MQKIKGFFQSFTKKLKENKKFRLFFIIGLALVIMLMIFLIALGGNKKGGSKEIQTAKPFFGDIEQSVSGSGTLEPNDRYEIISLVTGDVIEAPFEEGDMVNEDDVVYIIDHEEQDKSIKSAQNSITKYKIRNKKYLDKDEFNKTLAKYTVKAEKSGILYDFNLKVDDKVNANVNVGKLQSYDNIIATIPFNAAQSNKINIGDSATVYMYPSMYSAEGVVTYKSYRAISSVGGAVYYDVEISVNGANLTLSDTSVSATIHTSSGDVDSPKSGTLKYDEDADVYPEVSGEVLSIPSNIKNGAKVKKGDVLFVIDSSDFLEEKTLAEFEYDDLLLNLENAEKRLENYNIKSPISGTVLTKNVKKGDTISGGNYTNSTLMVVADMSAMKFVFSADETDINKIKVGQEVIVEADAVENKRFYGEVENVATEGVSSNGVSYYDVTVIIYDYGQNDEEGTLRSGMNVSAEIVYEKSENVLCVPVSAVTKLGNEEYVFVKGKKTNVEASGDEVDEKQKGMLDRLKHLTPEGFGAVKVTTGASNGMYIAILSGISENDEIYIQENDNVQAPVWFGSASGFTGGMPGGMMGGMSGGMPGGGMRR